MRIYLSCRVATNDDKSGDGVQQRQLHGDVYGILAALFMQDGPYLVLRLYMIIVHSIKGELQFFFAGKNAVTIALLLYRLYAIQCKRKEDEERYNKDFKAASDAIIKVSLLRELKRISSFKNDKDVDENGNRKVIKQLSFQTNA